MSSIGRVFRIIADRRQKGFGEAVQNGVQASQSLFFYAKFTASNRT